MAFCLGQCPKGAHHPQLPRTRDFGARHYTHVRPCDHATALMPAPQFEWTPGVREDVQVAPSPPEQPRLVFAATRPVSAERPRLRSGIIVVPPGHETGCDNRRPQTDRGQTQNVTFEHRLGAPWGRFGNTGGQMSNLHNDTVGWDVNLTSTATQRACKGSPQRGPLALPQPSAAAWWRQARNATPTMPFGARNSTKGGPAWRSRTGGMVLSA